MNIPESVYNEKVLSSYDSIVKLNVLSKPTEFRITLTENNIYGIAYIQRQTGQTAADPEYEHFIAAYSDIDNVMVNRNAKPASLIIKCKSDDSKPLSITRMIIPNLKEVDEIAQKINQLCEPFKAVPVQSIKDIVAEADEKLPKPKMDSVAVSHNITPVKNAKEMEAEVDKILNEADKKTAVETKTESDAPKSELPKREESKEPKPETKSDDAPGTEKHSAAPSHAEKPIWVVVSNEKEPQTPPIGEFESKAKKLKILADEEIISKEEFEKESKKITPIFSTNMSIEEFSDAITKTMVLKELDFISAEAILNIKKDLLPAAAFDSSSEEYLMRIKKITCMHKSGFINDKEVSEYKNAMVFDTKKEMSVEDFRIVVQKASILKENRFISNDRLSQFIDNAIPTEEDGNAISKISILTEFNLIDNKKSAELKKKCVPEITSSMTIDAFHNAAGLLKKLFDNKVILQEEFNTKIMAGIPEPQKDMSVDAFEDAVRRLKVLKDIEALSSEEFNKIKHGYLQAL